MAEPRKVRVGISSCLLGQEVRYNGAHKRDAFLTEILGRYVEWVPVCPEVELGLGVPRPPIRLERIGGGGVRLVMPDTGADLTAAMRGYAERQVEALRELDLAGYVLKKDSPSCGMERVKVHHGAGAAAREGRGLFAEVLMERLPHLPVEEEGRLNDPRLRESFVARVFAYDRWLAGERAGWTRAALLRFHERHELLLMARHRAAMRRLGRLLAESGHGDDVEALARSYLDGLTAILRRPPSRRSHAGVLRHLAGYLADRIDEEDRLELTGAIDRYRRGLVPLAAPLTLVRGLVRRLGLGDLQQQVYLEPHADELMPLHSGWPPPCTPAGDARS